jgi:hypothetical protein
MVEDASGTRPGIPRQPRAGPTSSPAASSNPGRGQSGPGRNGRGLRIATAQGHLPRHDALRPTSMTMPRPAASQPVRSGARPGIPSTAPQPRPRYLRPRHPCPDLSTPCVTAMLSTRANHNYPADRLPEARVATSCTPPSNLVQNQDDRVFAHYGEEATGGGDRSADAHRVMCENCPGHGLVRGKDERDIAGGSGPIVYHGRLRPLIRFYHRQES